MSKDDIVGIFGAVLSSVFATLGFLWSIGVLQLIFSFLAGSFTTYVIQRRLQMESEKRKISRENAIVMRDTIYGPIFKDLSEILESVKLVDRWDWDILGDLKGIRTHYLFFTISQDLKNKLSELLNRVEKYQTILIATETMLQNIVREETKKVYHVDVGFDARGIRLSLLIGEITVSEITLQQILFLDIAPKDFVRTETEKWGKGILVKVSIRGEKSDNLSDFESLYKLVLPKIGKEPLYTEERKQRARLINELEAFLEQIKVFVNLE